MIASEGSKQMSDLRMVVLLHAMHALAVGDRSKAPQVEHNARLRCFFVAKMARSVGKRDSASQPTSLPYPVMNIASEHTVSNSTHAMETIGIQ